MGARRVSWRRLLVVVAAIAAAAAADVRPAAGRTWREQSAGDSKTKTAGSATPMPPAFGRQQMWQPSPAAIGDLHKCPDPISVDCVHKVMERHGAGADAFEFYRRTGWFLSKLRDTGGPVMLATVVNPWRANENEQPALLGGNPPVVYPEEVQVPLEKDAGFKSLKADYPDLMFWKPGPTLETSALTGGGQSFIFRYRLLDGCHACPIRGWARVEFEFAPDGTYHRAKVLDVIRQ